MQISNKQTNKQVKFKIKRETLLLESLNFYLYFLKARNVGD